MLQQGVKMEGMNRKLRCGHVPSALRPDPAPGRLAPRAGKLMEEWDGNRGGGLLN